MHKFHLYTYEAAKCPKRIASVKVAENRRDWQYEITCCVSSSLNSAPAPGVPKKAAASGKRSTGYEKGLITGSNVLGRGLIFTT